MKRNFINEGRQFYRDLNVELGETYKLRNENDEFIIPGCNYHLTWQSNSSMRFILHNIVDGKAVMRTRTTKKEFLANLGDLIFIKSWVNLNKAQDYCERFTRHHRKQVLETVGNDLRSS